VLEFNLEPFGFVQSSNFRQVERRELHIRDVTETNLDFLRTLREGTQAQCNGKSGDGQQEFTHINLEIGIGLDSEVKDVWLEFYVCSSRGDADLKPRANARMSKSWTVENWRCK
jgi:hypothetical protein